MTPATSRRELERWLATAAFNTYYRFRLREFGEGECGRRASPRQRLGGGVLPRQSPDSRMCSLPLEADDRRVQRLGRTHRIEVLAKKRDLPGPGTKEHDILLAVHTSGPLDETFRLHFGDSGCWVGEGMHSHVRKAELLHCSQEPSYVSNDRFAAG